MTDNERALLLAVAKATWPRLPNWWKASVQRAIAAVEAERCVAIAEIHLAMDTEDTEERLAKLAAIGVGEPVKASAATSHDPLTMPSGWFPVKAENPYWQYAGRAQRHPIKAVPPADTKQSMCFCGECSLVRLRFAETAGGIALDGAAVDYGIKRRKQPAWGWPELDSDFRSRLIAAIMRSCNSDLIEDV